MRGDGLISTVTAWKGSLKQPPPNQGLYLSCFSHICMLRAAVQKISASVNDTNVHQGSGLKNQAEAAMLPRLDAHPRRKWGQG